MLNNTKQVEVNDIILKICIINGQVYNNKTLFIRIKKKFFLSKRYILEISYAEWMYRSIIQIRRSS